MKQWVSDYLTAHKSAVDSIPAEAVGRLIDTLKQAHREERHIFVIGNDYSYEDIFVRQLENYGRAGDLAIGVSVSGNSPNCVKALDWAKKNGLRTIALVGGKRGRMADIGEQVIVINDTHYGRVEDC